MLKPKRVNPNVYQPPSLKGGFKAPRWWNRVGSCGGGRPRVLIPLCLPASLQPPRFSDKGEKTHATDG